MKRAMGRPGRSRSTHRPSVEEHVVETKAECSHYWEVKTRQDYRGKKMCVECGEPQPTLTEYAVCRLCGELTTPPKKPARTK